MTSRERVTRALRHEPVDRVPREIWALPGVHWFQKDDFDEVTRRFPGDFGAPVYGYGQGRRCQGVPCVVGEYVDAWGCVWQVGEPGVIGEVKESPLSSWAALAAYQPPFELLDEADFSRVNESCAKMDLFTKVGTETRPFERLQFLRGTEQLFMDLAYGDKEIHKLIEMLHDFYCREMQMWAKTDVDSIAFMDDWGSQTALLISPDMWREVFKPLYRDYCDIIKGAGKYVFFHSDGNIESIYPDLIEIGVDAQNSQLFCMDIEGLARKYNGKITFWGEIDRQHILPFGSEEDARNAVRRVRAAMDKGQGGVIAQCEWGIDTPARNIAAVYDEWEKGR